MTKAPVASDHDVPDEGPRNGGRSGLRGFLTELPVLILIAFVLALVMKTFLIQAFYIPSASMEPTLLVNDRVLVNKVVYEVREPRRGEIVVFRQSDRAEGEDAGIVQRAWEGLVSGLGVVAGPDKDFIKRIIGLPGDVIEMRDGVVYINDVALEESVAGAGGYIGAADERAFGPVTVPGDSYFMMGDNRRWSQDSRSTLGMIDREDIVGRAFVTIFPFDRMGRLTGAEYGAGLDGDGTDVGVRVEVSSARSARTPVLGAFP